MFTRDAMCLSVSTQINLASVYKKLGYCWQTAWRI